MLLGMVLLPLAPLLIFPMSGSRPLSYRKGVALLILLDMGLILGTLIMDHPGSLCRSCLLFPREGLLLSLALLGGALPFLLSGGEKNGEIDSPLLVLGIVSLAIFFFTRSGETSVMAGGALLVGALILGAFLLSRKFPGAYFSSFYVRFGIAMAVLLLLSFRPVHDFLSDPVRLTLVLAAGFLLLPAPFPRRTERVSSVIFLRTDLSLFACLPPLLVFHAVESTFSAGGEAPSSGLIFVCLLFGGLGLLYGKTALFTEDLACGLTTAGTSLALAGLLTRSPEGIGGGLDLVFLLPLTTALSGLTLSFLSTRHRSRTIVSLAGMGSRHDPLRLFFFLGAFQGMSLPLVGGFFAEWSIFQAMTEKSLLLAIGGVLGLFFAFVLVLNRTQTLFMGEGQAGLSFSDMKIAAELTSGEKWSLGLAFVLLLTADLFLSFLGGIGT
jgi:hypothetical protein